MLSKFVSRELTQNTSQSWFNIVSALLYKRLCNERRNGNPPTPNNLSLSTLYVPPSNHSSCSDVPSEYPIIISHTIITTLINSTMPQHPTSQHLKPFHYHNNSYCHYLTIFPSHLPVYPRLHLSISLIPSICPILFLCTRQSITGNSRHDSISLLCSRSSENSLQLPGLHWIMLMKFPSCLQPIHKLGRFPCYRIIPSPSYEIL